MQCIVVKSGEFENSYSLLYILLNLCWCSLATLAPQQLEKQYNRQQQANHGDKHDKYTHLKSLYILTIIKRTSKI